MNQKSKGKLRVYHKLMKDYQKLNQKLHQQIGLKYNKENFLMIPPKFKIITKKLLINLVPTTKELIKF